MQAYTTSQTIHTRFVNQSFNILIALNALAHPVLSRLYAGQVAKKRFACVLIEFFLDIAWASILPVCVFVNYWYLERTLTAEQILYTVKFGYFEKAQREIRHLVILSWWQFLLALVPATSALLNLRSLTKLLATVQLVTSDGVPSSPDASMLRPDPPTLTKPGPLAPPQPSQGILVSLTTDRRKSSLVQWGHRLITITGNAICLVSIAATGMFESAGRISDASCVHRLYPWFVTDDACIVVILNCMELQISGRQPELDNVLKTIDLPSIGLFIFTGCPALVVPTSLIEAVYLTSLVILDSTITEWPMEIGLTTASFPPIVLLGLTNSSLASPPPDGLVAGPTWPDSLERVLFRDTDVDELAQRLTTQWSLISSWMCISCGLKSFPPAFYSMAQVERWSIWNSSIKDIPTLVTYPSITLWPALLALTLANNPLLTSIGDDVWFTASSGTIRTFSLASTNVQDIPLHWRSRLPRFDFSLVGFDSSLCSNNSVLIQDVPALDCSALDTANSIITTQ
ncbi:hypothetical protein Poli38472_001370 [Pythium oligandrum]|uniref:Uncharacterized protein n=1 Tax=Pythium oligandrum TaxID=41045 RepID=A0A8K1CTZ8_PYTOL|nr:hypothetical protein Poli38472_001370 [Pythium oligandrum]|eukprot:TMW69214.1 hypothetical protein Poli38472_001370 [Pythium oligandrum]